MAHPLLTRAWHAWRWPARSARRASSVRACACRGASWQPYILSCRLWCGREVRMIEGMLVVWLLLLLLRDGRACSIILTLRTHELDEVHDPLLVLVVERLKHG